jgi:hypothetical protein
MTSPVEMTNLLQGKGLSIHPSNGRKWPNKFVIPTEAHPDFLPRCTGHNRVCAFVKENRTKFNNATNLHRKSGVA